MVESAVSLMLLVAAALLLRSFTALLGVPPGVRIDHVLTAGLSLPETARYAGRAQVAAFDRQLLLRLQSLPGVHSAALVSCLPVDGYCSDSTFHIEGRLFRPNEVPYALDRAVSPGYFATVGIPLLEGRALSEEDTRGSGNGPARMSAVVVSQTMAREYWPNGAAIGQRIHLGDADSPAYQVVGIAADVLIDLGDRPRPTMYLPILEGDYSSFFAVLHTQGDPAVMASALREAISSLDPDIPAFKVRTMADLLQQSAANRQFTALLLGLFGLLAVALAAVGLYGVLSCTVAQRIGEIGIRMALGAKQADVWRLVMFEGMRPALLGVVLGVLGAAWAARFLRALLFRVGPDDGPTFIAMPLLFVVVALVACAIPAWRAVKVDPAMSLRHE